MSFAGCCISIECDDPASTRVVEQMYGHLTADASIVPRARFRLRREAGELALFCGDTLEYRGPSVEMVAAMLLDRSVYHLALAHRDGALLHAACVARDGQAVLLPGVSGAGKTTLTAWLARRGYDYLTDELVFLREGSTHVEAFRRPLNIKRPTPPALEALFPCGDGASIIQTPDGFLVSPTLFGPSSGAAKASLIVFPSYQEGAPLALQPISAGRSAMRLLACLVNARQLPEHGLAHTTYLARALPAYILTWGRLEHIDEFLERQLEGELHASRRQLPRL